MLTAMQVQNVLRVGCMQMHSHTLPNHSWLFTVVVIEARFPVTRLQHEKVGNVFQAKSTSLLVVQMY